MPDCRYCDAAFDDEGAYHDHLREEHGDELGPIDRRRVGGEDGGVGIDKGMLALGAVIAIPAALLAYLVFFSGGGSGAAGAPGTPHGVGTVHYHGTINLTVEGEQVDFTRPEYKHPRESPAFHFEGRNDPRWHVHAEGVTIQYAMGTLGIEVRPDEVVFDGTGYRDADRGTDVVIEVDGEPVDPRTYVLQPEDHVRIAVRTS